MKFSDEGYIINCKKHGERSLILTVLCKNYGKVCGYVKSGLSKKNLAIFQLGNLIKFDAWSRVDDNMLSLTVELITPHAVNFMSSPQKLTALSSFCALSEMCLPELQPLDRFYYLADSFVNLINEDNWLTHYCYFEFYLMSFLGVALDLEKCSVTGSYDNLKYVSPRTGKAVCEEVGLPYHKRLYAYPQFILDKNYQPKRNEIKNLLKMTEFFLHKNFFRTHYLKFPPNRANLLDNLNLDKI